MKKSQQLLIVVLILSIIALIIGYWEFTHEYPGITDDEKVTLEHKTYHSIDTAKEALEKAVSKQGAGGYSWESKKGNHPEFTTYVLSNIVDASAEEEKKNLYTIAYIVMTKDGYKVKVRDRNFNLQKHTKSRTDSYVIGNTIVKYYIGPAGNLPFKAGEGSIVNDDTNVMIAFDTERK